MVCYKLYNVDYMHSIKSQIIYIVSLKHYIIGK